MAGWGGFEPNWRRIGSITLEDTPNNGRFQEWILVALFDLDIPSFRAL